VSRTHGLFIYARTVYRFTEEGIQDFHTDNLLYLILPDESRTGALPREFGNINTYEYHTKELDMMYTQAREQSFRDVHHEKDKEQLAALFRQVVGAIVILFDLLSLIAVADSST
jgi:hypothetical protein